MYIISNKPEAESLLKFYIEELNVPQKAIYVYPLSNGYYLYWSSVRAVDNLTIFQDGFVIGKTAFSQSFSDTPFECKEQKVPDVINPLLSYVVIRKVDNGWQVSPGEQGIAYYSNSSISDYSLLLALLYGLMPSQTGVGMLAATGYFVSDATLFTEIKRVKYLHGLTLPHLEELQLETFNPGINNDVQLLQHFTNILPSELKASISMSGGMDSRFVLGILLKKGIVPDVYTLPGEETHLVEQICKHLKLNLTTDKSGVMDSYQYTIRTDARIYSSGGHYYKMINSFKPDQYIFNGLCAEPALKNVYSSVWKDFRIKKEEVIDQIISHVYLGDVKENIIGLKVSKSELKQKYKELFNAFKQLTKQLKKHEITRLFNHYNRSINWVQAHTMDLSYTIYPLFLLANKKAVELGIRSPLYRNLYADRLRRMNKALLPECKVDYSDNRSFECKPYIIRDIHKVYHEYLSRFFVYLKDRNETRKGGLISEKSTLEVQEAKEFSSVFSYNIHELLEHPEVRKNTKRAAITVNNVLLLLDKYKLYKSN